MTTAGIGFLCLTALFITAVITDTIKSIKKQKGSTKDDLNKKVIETIKVLDNRPLNQKGVIISHFIGTAGMSPAQAEQVILTYIEDYSDYKEEIEHEKIKHKVAFYKEYWFSDGESGNNRIQIDII